MPTYQYQCSACEKHFDIVCSYRDLNPLQECTHCGGTSERVYTPLHISPAAKAFEAHYNWGLGKKVHSKHEIKEELRRIEGDTGREIVEVGNDSLQSIKPTKKKYDVDLSKGGYNS